MRPGPTVALEARELGGDRLGQRRKRGLGRRGAHGDAGEREHEPPGRTLLADFEIRGIAHDAPTLTLSAGSAHARGLDSFAVILRMRFRAAFVALATLALLATGCADERAAMEKDVRDDPILKAAFRGD